MSAKIQLPGTNSYRLKALSNLSSALARAGVRRMVNGPRLPGWSWAVEIATEILRRRLSVAFEMSTLEDARRFLNSIAWTPPTHSQVKRTPVVLPNLRGHWFEPRDQSSGTMLYFHGGGYTFYPHAYSYFVELITQASHCRAFALDYRLAPEHRFPAQLEDAITAYTWLLSQAIAPENLFLAGDSAGAHLALGCVLKLRELNLPMPALVIALSPPVDFEPDWPSFARNAEFDWIQKPMLEKWVDYFCSIEDRANPLIALARANFTNLCPIYIQCGEAEILYDSIQAFGEHLQAQGAWVTLESWPEMNHVFQIFGSYAPQSTQALSQIGNVISQTVVAKQEMRAVQ